MSDRQTDFRETMEEGDFRALSARVGTDLRAALAGYIPDRSDADYGDRVLAVLLAITGLQLDTLQLLKTPEASLRFSAFGLIDETINGNPDRFSEPAPGAKRH